MTAGFDELYGTYTGGVPKAPAAARSNVRTAIVAGLLGVLLALVATLQYRWTGELGRAAEERARAGLDRAAVAFAADLDRELARLLFHFHPGGPGGDVAVGERLRAWRAMMPEPDLLREVFVVRRGDAGAPVVERWDLASGRPVPAELPAELRPLGELLAEVPGREGARRRPLGPWVEVPALVVPGEMDHGGPFRRRAGGGEPHVAHAGGPDLLLWLDERVLREDLLPELGNRYFAGEVDYRVEVRDASGRLVWSQGPAVGGGEPDAVAALLTLGTALGRPRWSAGDPEGGPGARGPRLRMPFEHGSPEQAWQLAVTHPAGSLSTAVARARWRQLGLSFAVLALLAVAAGILLVAARRAEALARRQVELVAGVSHELLTPVAALRSAGENLAAGVVTDAAQVRRYGELVEREGRRLGALVEQVLTWAGLQARGVAPVRRSIAPADLVAAVAATCAAEAAAAGVALETRVAPGLPPLSGDPDALERALRNLVENALRHAAGGGWVAVGAEAGPARGRREVALFVEDRGAGVAAEDLPHLWEPFFRGRGARTGGVAGSGLGLALVRQIAEAHGGRVRASRAVPTGARFTLELPAGSPGAEAVENREDAATPRDAATAPSRHGETVPAPPAGERAAP